MIACVHTQRKIASRKRRQACKQTRVAEMRLVAPLAIQSLVALISCFMSRDKKRSGTSPCLHLNIEKINRFAYSCSILYMSIRLLGYTEDDHLCIPRNLFLEKGKRDYRGRSSYTYCEHSCEPTTHRHRNHVETYILN